MRSELQRIVILPLILWSHIGMCSSAKNPLDRLRDKIPVNPVVKVAPTQLAGQYTSTSEELRRHVGPFLSGSDLYLFPDGTYIYCEWADIEPVTIHDKGTWALVEGLVELQSDQEVTWNPNVQRKYVLVRRSTHPREILLVGIERDLPYFEKQAGDSPELMLLIVAKVRTQEITQAGCAKLKSKLMREAWRPHYFAMSRTKN